MAKLTSLADDALIAFDNVSDSIDSLFHPTLRLGVTGLARSGKTVFITTLVHNLLHGGRLPLFSAMAEGRLSNATLQPQPDDAVARFQYEDHLKVLIEERLWPQSTRAISQLRVTIDYESASAFNRTFGPGKLSLDIVDYPGEWLLDLPLLAKSYEEWSREALALSRLPNRNNLSEQWHLVTSSQNPSELQDEPTAQRLSDAFKAYLQACRDDENALSTLPPGRFLMPGDLEGSPALTFAPLDLAEGAIAGTDSLHAMMAHRFEAYKTHVVKPFFREHFARIDRQIVLVDALQALNAGPGAVADLQTALVDILGCFNPGRNSWLTSLFTTRTDRILFAATKADHLHHENHDRLEKLLKNMVDQAVERAHYQDAKVDVIALAALRATHEAEVKQDGEQLPVIVGTPLPNEKINDERFDGLSETAIFPGDLPEDPANLLVSGEISEKSPPLDLNFVRFRPPATESDGINIQLPHIRLDRAIEFLIGDRLQ